ncbi:MAG: type II toxin-antitoxin system prevent-host-death family antitoxin [Micrococcales bacterium]|nr:type II toxin-antitoxin system prevent-host-death family antitoxin [Micrococcales bacterium]
MSTVSATEANRSFSRLLGQVSRGETVTILSRGRPVAVLSPVDVATARREQAKVALLERLAGQRVSGEPRGWSRDDLYGDDT